MFNRAFIKNVDFARLLNVPLFIGRGWCQIRAFPILFHHFCRKLQNRVSSYAPSGPSLLKPLSRFPYFHSMIRKPYHLNTLYLRLPLCSWFPRVRNTSFWDSARNSFKDIFILSQDSAKHIFDQKYMWILSFLCTHPVFKAALPLNSRHRLHS